MTAKNYFYLSLIFLFGLFLRVYLLGTVPTGFTPDEASQAYSAYSLLKTGKDEWGIPWPTSSFRSFLDYKSALQTYLMIPTVAIFGLNEFATRLPSAIFGSLAIISSFALVVQLTKNIKLGLLTSFVLATSPWAIQFSRMALEANLAVVLITSGLYFLLKSFEKPKLLILSAILFSVSLYSYHAAKLFVPIFLFVIFLIYKKNFLKTPKVLVTSLLVALILCLPLIRNLSGEDSKRGADLLITNISTDHLKSLNDTIFYHDLYQYNQYIPRLFHNKITLVANNFTNNYLSYFSPHFWFLEGGREITYSVIPSRGLLLLYLLPFFIYGLIAIAKSSLPKSTKLLLLAWLVLAPLPAALTKEGYRPNRAISFMFLLEFISAFGLYSFLVQGSKFFQLKRLIILLVFCLSFVFYLEDYAYASKIKFPDSMSYGWRDAVGYLAKTDSAYKQVIVEQGSQSQAMVAFYKKINPVTFQSFSKEWSEQISKNKDIKYLDQLGNYNLLNYKFKSFAWPEDISSDYLYLSHKLNNLPAERRTLKQITSPQGKIIMEVFDFPKK